MLADVLRNPQTLYTAAIMLIFSIYNLISGSFWGVIVTQKMLFPDSSLAFFQFIRAVVMILFFFVVMPRIGKLHFKVPSASFIQIATSSSLNSISCFVTEIVVHAIVLIAISFHQ